ncbi:MAG: phosphate transport system regulatory protein PhoU [Bacillaceae bacterium]|jgi:phosphate transport system protein|uniref:Phosphate-specific transport system accessory protein PhoU n=2 Tax=Aeribacillus TaxID=1055323 RepID=A0A165XRA3_9BACI|nr:MULTISPECIES: phosphate signaling complex protein PhoU [Aeribacillus]REJ18496.1 MAG: phosphate transport system regulatory protein PhoU [Bacillaceae bacterium]ASS91918.1 phosphate transport system regulatory protein PhoU [Aeribacillus pallidus]KZM56790.1 phosphate transport system regulatory protein PhoU [Aeribacillus pallidus]KZN96320.1 phosphate transport system regulatory protein PhoU [Aeribacillus pallidus]MDR9793362.1 phosphate signaling complex protein PhoU [Aeribacillus pallidus]
MREKFELDLNTLHTKLIEIGSLTEVALGKSIRALEKQDIDLAIEVLEQDVNVDQLEEEINDFAILLIAKQQPVAIDLRRIIVSIKIAADIERMADNAVNIAKSAIRIGNEPLIKPLEQITKMHKLASEMLSLSLKAYHEEDVALARKIAEIDDEVDDLYGEAIKELLQIIPENLEYMNQITQLSLVARFIERTADHATNIAENVLYLVKGRHYALND